MVRKRTKLDPNFQTLRLEDKFYSKRHTKTPDAPIQSPETMTPKEITGSSTYVSSQYR
jgi:hypothetical protein